MQPYVLDALYGATAIKFATKVSDAAAHALARDMHTTPDFILDQPPYHFAAYVRGFTAHAEVFWCLAGIEESSQAVAFISAFRAALLTLLLILLTFDRVG